MTRRYGAGVRGYRLGLTAETIAALDAVWPAGRRASLCKAAMVKPRGRTLMSSGPRTGFLAIS